MKENIRNLMDNIERQQAEANFRLQISPTPKLTLHWSITDSRRVRETAVIQ